MKSIFAMRLHKKHVLPVCAKNFTIASNKGKKETFFSTDFYLF